MKIFVESVEKGAGSFDFRLLHFFKIGLGNAKMFHDLSSRNSGFILIGRKPPPGVNEQVIIFFNFGQSDIFIRGEDYRGRLVVL